MKKKNMKWQCFSFQVASNWKGNLHNFNDPYQYLNMFWKLLVRWCQDICVTRNTDIRHSISNRSFFVSNVNSSRRNFGVGFHFQFLSTHQQQRIKTKVDKEKKNKPTSCIDNRKILTKERGNNFHLFVF